MVETPPINHLVFAVHQRVPEADRATLLLSLLSLAGHRRGQGDPGGRIAGRGSSPRRTTTTTKVRHYRPASSDPGAAVSRPRSSGMSLKYRIAATILGARDRGDRRRALDHARPFDAQRPRADRPAPRRSPCSCSAISAGRRCSPTSSPICRRSSRAPGAIRACWRWWWATRRWPGRRGDRAELIGAPFPAEPVARASIATGARARSAVAPACSARWRSSSPTIRWCSPTAPPAISASASRSSAWSRSRWSGSRWAFFLTRRLQRARGRAPIGSPRGDLAVRVAADRHRRGGPRRPRLQQHGGAARRQSRRAARGARSPGRSRPRRCPRASRCGTPSDRLVRYNRRFRELFGDRCDADRCSACASRTLARLICQRLSVDDGEALEAWLAERLARHRNPRGPRELPLQRRPLARGQRVPHPGGGTVGIYTDITEAKLRQQRARAGRAAPARDHGLGDRRHRHRRRRRR